MKKRDLTEEERTLWLEENGQKAPSSKPSKPPVTAPKASAKKSEPLAMGAAHIEKKRRQATIDARIDLHGMTQDKAHKTVTAFVRNAISSGQRTLLIITGKSGVLRNVVPKWLDTASLRPFILAISYATPKEGGEGALRVLLRKQR
jgi:DNA-nicking Smr family endonuclease